MKKFEINGQTIIDSISKKLEEDGILCTDSNIINKLRNLDKYESRQLFDFGDVLAWHNARQEENND